MTASRVVFAQQPLPATRERLGTDVELMANDEPDAWTPARLRSMVADADALVAYMTERVDSELLDACPRLRIVAGALKGHDNIDVDACTDRGIWVTVVPDLLTVPTAELAIGLTIGLGRHLIAGDGHVRSGRFTGWSPRFYGLGLAGATAGIVGMGAVGRAIAHRLLAFDSHVVYHDLHPLPADDPLAGCCAPRALDTLIAESDVVLLAAPLTANTHHLISADRLARMRPHALLVNPGRGSVADEHAVAEALAADQLGGYAADVFEMEDLSRDDRLHAIPAALRQHPRTLFAPHLGSAVTDVRERIEAHAADNVRRVLEGETPVDAVNRPGACRAT